MIRNPLPRRRSSFRLRSPPRSNAAHRHQKLQLGRDLLEIADDRHGRGSTIVTSQLPVDHWHELIVDPTIADAILDRLVHTAHRLTLDGETLRKPAEKSGKRSKLDTDNAE